MYQTLTFVFAALSLILIGKVFKHRDELEKQCKELEKKFKGTPTMLTDILAIGDEFNAVARCSGYDGKLLDLMVICPVKGLHLKVCQLPPMEEVACELGNCNPYDTFVLQGSKDLATDKVKLSIKKVSTTPALDEWLADDLGLGPKMHEPGIEPSRHLPISRN